MNDLFSVSGRRVVITGGSQGIGAMLASAFVDNGAHVTIVGRDLASLRAVSSATSDPSRCVALEGDVATEAGCRAIADAVLDVGASLDVLVNNAGTALDAPFADYDDAAWDHVLAVNLKGAAHLTRFLLPALRAAATPGSPARVLMMGSIAGLRVGDLDNYGYTTSKAALHHLGKHLARRLAPEITVNVIAPGPFASRMMAGVLETHGDALARSVPLGRIGEPGDIAGAALYLCSPAGRWVTGTVLTVDGGLSIT
jgi:NAD(P)-dependent dehydrogenase (short-subunit alcohol dehydrogenase family)